MEVFQGNDIRNAKEPENSNLSFLNFYGSSSWEDLQVKCKGESPKSKVRLLDIEALQKNCHKNLYSKVGEVLGSSFKEKDLNSYPCRGIALRVGELHRSHSK
jgi:hypothetical protein